jgi:integrase
MASIEKRGVNSYRLIVEVGFGPDNNRIKRYKPIKIEEKFTPKKLKEYLADELLTFKREVESGDYKVPEKMTFSSFVEEWRKRYADDELKPKTRKGYENELKSRILPIFGHKQLIDIKTKHLVDFISDLKKPGSRKDGKGTTLSSSTVLYIYKVVKCIFDRAHEWRMLSSNPMHGVKRPTAERNKASFYNDQEAELLIKTLYDKSVTIGWRLYFLGCLIGGFRRGELIALEWDDISFEDSTININKNISVSENGIAIVGKPKGKVNPVDSFGDVDMPEWYMDELKIYQNIWEREREDCGELWLGAGRQYVFHTGKGEPYYPGTPTMVWAKFLKKHSLRHIRLHDLRHTSGSLLFEAGEDIKSIQERLRHSDSRITADIYVHVTKKKKKLTAHQFDRFAPSSPIRPQ